MITRRENEENRRNALSRSRFGIARGVIVVHSHEVKWLGPMMKGKRMPGWGPTSTIWKLVFGWMCLFLLALLPLTCGADETLSDEAAYLGPAALAISPAGDRMYVACADGRVVLAVALPAGDVEQRWEVPATPTGLCLSADGRRLIVTCAAPRSQVLLFDVLSGRIENTLPAGHTAMSPVLDEARRRVYVCNRFDNSISVLDLVTGRQLARVPVAREPVAAVLTVDAQRLLIANHLPHRRADSDFDGEINAVVSVMDAATYEVNEVELFRGATGVRGICVTPDGRYAFVTHLLGNFENVPFRVDMGWINVNVVSVIDLSQMKTRSTIGLDEMYQGSANPWGIACGEEGSVVWTASAGTHELSVIATGTLVSEQARRTMSPLPGAWPVYPSLGATLWTRCSLPGKGPRAVAVHGSTAYVAEYYSDTIAVVGPAGAADPEVRTVRSIRLGPPPQMTVERQGQLYFDDATLCYQHWQSCASCHPDGRADGLNWDLMNDGIGNPKNSKSMLLAHQTPPSMAKGVRATAEVAVRSGLTHILFARRPEAEAAAMDAYLKSLRPIPSPYLVDGQLSDAARRGKQLFESERIACHRCHPPALYTDLKKRPMGRSAARYFDNHFDTPTLIECWRTAPYWRDGRYPTIEALLREEKHGVRGVELTDQEIEDLAEYVLSL